MYPEAPRHASGRLKSTVETSVKSTSLRSASNLASPENLWAGSLCQLELFGDPPPRKDSR